MFSYHNYSTDLDPVNHRKDLDICVMPIGPQARRVSGDAHRGCYGHQRTDTPWLFNRPVCWGSPSPDCLYYTTLRPGRQPLGWQRMMLSAVRDSFPVGSYLGQHLLRHLFIIECRDYLVLLCVEQSPVSVVNAHRGHIIQR